MPIRYRSAKVLCDLFGEDVHVEFSMSGPADNPDIRVHEAWVMVAESGAVVSLTAALTRTSYSRKRRVWLPKEVFPLIRNGAWDALIEAAERNDELHEDADRTHDDLHDRRMEEA